MTEKSRNSKLFEEEISDLNNKIKNLEFQSKNHVNKKKIKLKEKKKMNMQHIIFMLIKQLKIIQNKTEKNYYYCNTKFC